MKRIYLKRIFFAGTIVALFFCSSLAITLVSNRNPNQYSNSSAFPKNSTIQGSSNTTGDEWPMFHNSLNHAGLTETTPISGENQIWNISIVGVFYSSPIVANGMVYFGTAIYGDNIYCVNEFTGHIIWEYNTNGNVIYAPAVANGMIYVGSSSSTHNYAFFYCLNASTGSLIWNYTSSNGISSSPIVSNGMVYFGSTGIICLNASNGNPIWNHVISGACTTPAIANGTVYTGCGDGNMYCLNASTGNLMWKYQTGASIESSPAVADGMVYVGSDDHNLYCLNANTGYLLWNYTTNDTIDSSPAFAYGMVYIGGEDDNFYCLNANTGGLIWNYSIHLIYYNGCHSSPAVSNGMVFVGNENSFLYCFNASTGNVIWDYSTGYDNSIYSSPAIANGMVFVTWGFDVSCLPMNLWVPPSDPTNFNISKINGEITLTWNPPAMIGNQPIIGYKIYRGVNDMDEHLYATVGNVLNFTDFSGSNDPFTYYYEISAYNSVGEGSLSSALNCTGSNNIGGMGVGVMLSVSLVGIVTAIITLKKQNRIKYRKMEEDFI